MIGNKINIDILLGAAKLSFYDRAEIVHRYNTQPELLAACKKSLATIEKIGDGKKGGVYQLVLKAIVEAEGKE